MKEKAYILAFLILLLTFTNAFSQWTVPRLVVQELLDYGASYPDDIRYPEEGTITYKAYITARPDNILTEENHNTYAHLSAGMFSLTFNLGNFPTLAGAARDWSYGEMVRIEALHKPTGRIAVTEFEIEQTGSGAIIRRGELAMVLQDPPDLEEGEQIKK